MLLLALRFAVYSSGTQFKPEVILLAVGGCSATARNCSGVYAAASSLRVIVGGRQISVILGIILRDYLGAILRIHAKNW